MNRKQIEAQALRNYAQSQKLKTVKTPNENYAYITVPVDSIDMHDFLTKHGLRLVKDKGPNKEMNRAIGVPQTGDILRHYSGMCAKIRSIYKEDGFGKILHVTNWSASKEDFQSKFYDFKHSNNQ